MYHMQISGYGGGSSARFCDCAIKSCPSLPVGGARRPGDPAGVFMFNVTIVQVMVAGNTSQC